MGNNNKIALARFRIANLEQIIEDIQYKGKSMPPKRTSTSEAPTMTQAAIRKLVADSVSAALETQAANMANTDNTIRPKEAPVARKCSYKEFMSCQPINFKGTEGAVRLICWFERTESVFSRSNCTEGHFRIPVSIICDRDPRFASNFWRSLQNVLGTNLDLSTAQTNDPNSCGMHMPQPIRKEQLTNHLD
ncbi:reverse transcriptase domain-containing protein [Tanacetum coccineum]